MEKHEIDVYAMFSWCSKMLCFSFQLVIFNKFTKWIFTHSFIIRSINNIDFTEWRFLGSRSKIIYNCKCNTKSFRKNENLKKKYFEKNDQKPSVLDWNGNCVNDSVGTDWKSKKKNKNLTNGKNWFFIFFSFKQFHQINIHKTYTKADNKLYTMSTELL